ncbi:MAG: sulfite exporter TauE/SafE family protein [Candidatus Kapabacteria bacterium]|nr:sulfite exporter TauE/SafE family protein [Candidatus Kapabacteria bacterium]MBX7153570.1 sulfite exporter TauE/SafE family protein [Bacteroidota bacterium]
MPQEVPLLLFFAALFVVAFLYSSVGHGGASGYLVLMALFSFTPAVMKPTALMLNILVSLIAFIQYYRGGYFNWKLFIPLALASIPFAFLGAKIHVDASIYKKILGVLLLLPIVRLSGFKFASLSTDVKPFVLPLALGIGAVIGLLSGMIGIGGGIILTPLLLLLHWANAKQSAGISALFIFVNSISGLVGQFQQNTAIDSFMMQMLGVAFVGGILGAYIGTKRFNNVVLQRVLALVLLVAAIKLLTV